MTTTTHSSATALEVTRQTLADPALTRRSPGEEFAWSVSRGREDGDTVVPIHGYLPAAFPLFATRPRYTVRHLLKVASVSDRPSAYVREAPQAGRDVPGNTYASTPESAFGPSVQHAELTDLVIDVPLPKGLLDEPALLAAFVDYRVLVRLGVVENESLLHGTADGRISGLLTLPEVRTGELGDDVCADLTAAAARVEDTGGSCDGIVAHPSLYWRLVQDGTLSKLTEVGIKVARTRMMPRGKALLGDFRAAVTLLDPGVSSLSLRRNAGPEGEDVVRAHARVGLAVHLPQHFLLLSRP
ncbi:family 3 encapsulin nanocompartment shell protein [Sphaerisporangium sp. NPDC005288]|uniref:family 3 encapsulin nanocompartment shell protein n=1 Tax=Sphaerisporangium sp. NPDC005288 TaxID=3155114 RepID=UPI0033A3B0ED